MFAQCDSACRIVANRLVKRKLEAEMCSLEEAEADLHVQLQAVDEGLGPRRPAEAQAGGKHLGKGVEPEDATVDVEGEERRRPLRSGDAKKERKKNKAKEKIKKIKKNNVEKRERVSACALVQSRAREGGKLKKEVEKKMRQNVKC
jgi:hypothetical protein